MDDRPIPLAGKRKRLRSLDEFEAPWWKGLFQPWREERVPVLVILVGFAAGALIGLLLIY